MHPAIRVYKQHSQLALVLLAKLNLAVLYQSILTHCQPDCLSARQTYFGKQHGIAVGQVSRPRLLDAMLELSSCAHVAVLSEESSRMHVLLVVCHVLLYASFDRHMTLTTAYL